MPRIKFSHDYFKLLDRGKRVVSARLMHMERTKIGNLVPIFLTFDGMHHAGNYWQDNKPYGEVLLLWFLKMDGIGVNAEAGLQFFPTIRRFTPDKFLYYRGALGQVFEVVVENASRQVSTRSGDNLHAEVRQ